MTWNGFPYLGRVNGFVNELLRSKTPLNNWELGICFLWSTEEITREHFITTNKNFRNPFIKKFQVLIFSWKVSQHPFLNLMNRNHELLIVTNLKMFQLDETFFKTLIISFDINDTDISRVEIFKNASVSWINLTYLQLWLCFSKQNKTIKDASAFIHLIKTFTLRVFWKKKPKRDN